MSQRAAPVLRAVVAVLVLALAGCAASTTVHAAAPAASRSGAFEPRFSRTEYKYVGAAWRATVAYDHACDGFHGRS